MKNKSAKNIRKFGQLDELFRVKQT